MNHRRITIWLTGLSGAGKSTLAEALGSAFQSMNLAAHVLDGDVLRAGLNRDLKFSRQDRQENIRRIAEVAKLFNAAGLIAIVAAISPFREDREAARAVIGAESFIEVHVNTALAICEQRDPKGLYRRARAGDLAEFTGVSTPYEPPLNPDVCIDGANANVQENVAAILKVAGLGGTRKNGATPVATF